MTKWQIVVPEDFKVTNKNYRFNGKEYIRVTQSLNIINKPGITAWSARVGRKKVETILKRRCDLGTTVHNLFERTLKGEAFNLGTYEKEIQEDLELFDEFRINCCIKAGALEQRLWSNKYEYAGTADAIADYKTNKKYLIRGHKSRFDNGAHVIIDWKTSADLYNSYWLQISAYIVAFEELTKIKLDGGVLVQFRNNRVRVREKTYKELIELFAVYKNALELYRWQHKLGKWAK